MPYISCTDLNSTYKFSLAFQYNYLHRNDTPEVGLPLIGKFTEVNEEEREIFNYIFSPKLKLLHQAELADCHPLDDWKYLRYMLEQTKKSKYVEFKDINIRMLLAKFQNLPNILLSMYLYEHEWRNNNLSDFRNQFLNLVKAQDFYKAFTKEFWLKHISQTFNIHFPSLNSPYWSPGYKALDYALLSFGVTGLLTTGLILITPASALIPLIITASVIIAIVVAIATAIGYKKAEQKDVKEEIVFRHLCHTSHQFLNIFSPTVSEVKENDISFISSTDTKKYLIDKRIESRGTLCEFFRKEYSDSANKTPSFTPR